MLSVALCASLTTVFGMWKAEKKEIQMRGCQHAAAVRGWRGAEEALNCMRPHVTAWQQWDMKWMGPAEAVMIVQYLPVVALVWFARPYPNEFKRIWVHVAVPQI